MNLITGLRANHFVPVYTGTKHAILGFVKSWGVSFKTLSFFVYSWYTASNLKFNAITYTKIISDNDIQNNEERVGEEMVVG
jgi:hypothetical protein